MKEKIDPQLLEAWNQYVSYLAYASFSVGLGIFIFYVSSLILATSYKKRYDTISIHEINYLWRASIFLLAGGTLYIATISSSSSWLFLLVRISVSATIAIIVGTVLQYTLKFYYPFYIEPRLKRLRYRPRISPDGRKMSLLGEGGEDVYLDEGMLAEKNVASIDYDVWVDEVSGYTKIEKYYGKLHAEQCPECQYRTLRTEKEEVLKTPTEHENGVLIKHARCNYCGHRHKQNFKLAKLSKQEFRKKMIGL